MKKILLIFIVLVIIDLLWLGLIKDKYEEQILKIQNEKMTVNYFSAFIVYALLAFGLYYFTKDETDAIIKIRNGFVLGLVSYGIYDFTNGAIFKNWDFGLAIADTVWGSLLCSLTVYVVGKIEMII